MADAPVPLGRVRHVTQPLQCGVVVGWTYIEEAIRGKTG